MNDRRYSAFLFLCSLIFVSAAYARDPQMAPVLKAIDPSLAKYDTPPAPPPPLQSPAAKYNQEHSGQDNYGDSGQPQDQTNSQSNNQSNNQSNGQSNNQAYSDDSGNPPPLDYENRVNKLEKTAFGSTFPEHELEDRVDHLEKEIFSSVTKLPLSARIAVLEQKVYGGSAFGQSANQYPLSSGPPANARSRTMSAQGQNGMYVNAPPQSGSLQPYPQQTNSVPGLVQTTSASSRPVTKPTVPQAPSQISQQAPQQAAEAPARQGAGVGSLNLQYVPQAGDYLQRVRQFSNNSFAHFSQFPVSVRMPANSTQAWQSSIAAGISRWAKYVQVVPIRDQQPCDIDVVWADQMPPKYLGSTRLLVRSGQMQVRIFLLKPTYYPPSIPEEVLEPVFCHELGHALGLFGHSDSPGDLMFESVVSGTPEVIKFSPISQRDINTLFKIYHSGQLSQDESMNAPLEWGISDHDYCGAVNGGAHDRSN